MKIEYSVRMVRRALSDEDYDLLYAKFLEEIKDLPNTWNLAGTRSLPDIGGGNLSTTVSIIGVLKRGMKGYINYMYRGDYLNDSEDDDDRLIIEFKSDKGLTKELAEILPTYIFAFGAYCMDVDNDAIRVQDWRKWSDGVIEHHPCKDVLHINAINYYDIEIY